MRKNKYNQEFKDSAIKLCLDSDKSISSIAKDLGLNKGTLSLWVSDYKKINNIKSPKDLNKESLEEENKRLKKELAVLKQEKEILLEIKEVIAKDEKLQEAFINIQSIKSVGEVSAIVLLHHFIQYPDANEREIISLAGLDPIEKSSGTSVKGRTRISKAGSKLCRSVLFMASLNATQYNKELKRFYNRLKENGKHTTVAQIAVMRKIVVIAHSIYKNNEKYDEERYKRYL